MTNNQRPADNLPADTSQEQLNTKHSTSTEQSGSPPENTLPVDTRQPQKIATEQLDMPQSGNSESNPKKAATSPKKKKAPKDGRIHVEYAEAPKERIHPRFAKGKYTNIRLFTMYSFLAVFLAMPWLKWDGHQAILFDVTIPKFYIFGAAFMPQDFYFFAFIFMIAAFTLFMVTVYAGRVWCGYVCPQTIYVHLYQYTEKIILGERNKRIKFNKEPMSLSKAGKLLALHSLWTIYSAITAATFVALVAGTDTLFFNGNPIFFMGWSKMVWVFFLLITAVTYANAAYMREQMCLHFCPYGRFQSVMLDKDTLVVSYDYERGEPRGARKKGADETGYGDCVDCTMCVQVCPTGIDIRNGLQAACIQCAACIDACNEIMDKVEKPRGLIRYTTERQLVEKETTKILSFRIFAYIAILCVMCTAATMVLIGRNPLELDIRHDRKQASTVGRNGKAENSYVLKIVNKTEEKQIYKVKLEPIDGIELKSRFKQIPLHAGEVYDWPVSLIGDSEKITKGRTPVTFTVYSENGKYTTSKEDFFEIN